VLLGAGSSLFIDSALLTFFSIFCFLSSSTLLLYKSTLKEFMRDSCPKFPFFQSFVLIDFTIKLKLFYIHHSSFTYIILSLSNKSARKLFLNLHSKTMLTSSTLVLLAPNALQLPAGRAKLRKTSSKRYILAFYIFSYEQQIPTCG
jgi:hypothetical protein